MSKPIPSSRRKPGPRLATSDHAESLGPDFRRGDDKGANSLPASGTLHGSTGPVKTIWQVPEEVPVAILFNSAPYAVMMATPADLDDFAAGFALAEGIITSASHIKGILTLPSEEGLAVDLAVDEKHLNRERMVKRSLEGRVGCGLCGIEDIKDAIRMPEGIVGEHGAFPAGGGAGL